MPLPYGEGQNAFIKLQEEIIKISDDQSLFAWNPPPPFSIREAAARATTFHGHEYIPRVAVLARDQTYLQDMQNFVPIPSTPGTPPYSMTNKSLNIQLPLLPKQ